MSEEFKDWKADIERRASEIVESPVDGVDQAIYEVATQMGDAGSLNIGAIPIEVTIEQLKKEGWHYRGPVSGAGVFEAVAEDEKEVRIVGTGTQRFLFEKEKTP